MSAQSEKSRADAGVPFHLSGLIGTAAAADGKRIGTLSDLVVVDKDKVAEVTHACVERPFGRAALIVPWAQVLSLSDDEVVLDVADEEAYAQPLPAGAVLLKDYILDKKVLDVAEAEVEMVYDIRLSLRGRALYVVEVEISRYALLRRLGLGWLAGLLYRSSARPGPAPAEAGLPVERRRSHRTVPWSYVQPLPENIGSFKGAIKLKVLKDELAKIPPVDVADILEELDHDQRVAVFHELETGQASDTLEELDPKFQRDLIAAIKKEKAAQLINEMTPGQGADLLAALPMAEARALLKLMDPAKAAKIGSILREQEARIADFTASRFLKFAPETTVAQARAVLQRVAHEHDNDAVMYLYVLDAAGVLLGIVAMRDLLLSDDATPLSAIMRAKTVRLGPDNTMKEAARLFKRYGFRAIPVVDAGGRMLGVLPYRDIVDLRGRDLG